MIILNYFEKNIKICFIYHIPNIIIFKQAKYQQLCIFNQNLFFLKDQNLVGTKKTVKLLKQIFKKHSHVICQQNGIVKIPTPYVSPSSRLILSLKSFLTVMKQIFIYFFSLTRLAVKL